MAMRICHATLPTAAALLTGCSQLLGLGQEPVLDDSKIIADAPVDTGMATNMPPPDCVPSACQFGCETTTNACREGKLWIFKTTGLFVGNAFGGTDTPPNVRQGADTRCLIEYSTHYIMRQCKSENIHAVIHVSTSDSLSSMTVKYSIPQNIQVLRADDTVLVADTWNDLFSPSKNLRAPVTTASAGQGFVWTGGNTIDTCNNWTSKVSTVEGTRGNTTTNLANWFDVDTFRCDLSVSVLCVCWPGEN